MSRRRQSTNKISRQTPKVIHVIMRKHVSEQVANSLARRNVSVNLLPAREYFLQRTVAQQVSCNLAQRLAGIENVAIRVHPGKHGWVALEAAESKQRLNRSRRAVDRLGAFAPPFDDFVYQRLVLRVLQQRQIRHFLHLRGLLGSVASASRLTTNPVTARKIRGLRSSSVPLVISSSERYLHSNLAASVNSSISARSVGSPPVITIESVSFRMRFSS